MSMYPTSQTALLRRESFGGTLFAPHHGRRIYINPAEFEAVVSQGLSAELANEIGLIPYAPVVIRVPKFLPEHNFSAPDTVFLEVTRACNLVCVQCFNSSGQALPGELSFEQLKAVVADLALAGVQEIRFTGGEPLRLAGIIDLIKLASNLSLRCSVGTNGTLINDVVASELAANGLSAAVVSFDGMEKRHNAIRGHNAFTRAIEGLDALERAGITTRVNMVVMQSNRDDVMPLVTMMVQRGTPVYLRRFIPAGRGAKMATEVLTAADYAQIRKDLRPYLYDPTIRVGGHYIVDEKAEPRIELPFTRHACSAGHRGMVILPDGKLQTCGFLGPLGEDSPARVPDESFAEIWRRLVSSTHISDLRSLLPGFNATTAGPRTNCLALALAATASAPTILQIGRRSQENEN